MDCLTISIKDSIQEALNSLDSTKKCVLRLLPGIYIEDIIFPPNITLEGSGVADLDFTVIKGKHFFPENGVIGFQKPPRRFEESNRPKRKGRDRLRSKGSQVNQTFP